MLQSYKATLAIPLDECVQPKLLLVHHGIPSNHSYEAFWLLMNNEWSRAMAARAVKNPRRHQRTANCKRVEIAPCRLGGEYLSRVSSELYQRNLHTPVGRLEIADHLNVPPVVLIVRGITVLPFEDDINLSSWLITDKLPRKIDCVVTTLFG
ncbi:hypothetical protein VTN31DRAFT_3189 [Thermomyces dupontii]|uniref:uncharacterized protein n=1 Tax=Talaromyces thermophilus TaxID=28565 RepID=UPI003743199E